MKKETHYKLRKLAVSAWLINAVIFTATLFLWHWAENINHWTQKPFEMLFITSSITKGVLSVIAPCVLAMVWDLNKTDGVL